jgi:hypothetical protein
MERKSLPKKFKTATAVLRSTGEGYSTPRKHTGDRYSPFGDRVQPDTK